MSATVNVRPALADDADFLAERIYAVSAGVAHALLDGLMPGIRGTDLLGMALRDENSHYSYKNCVLAEVDGRHAGLLFAYDAAQQHIPPLVERVATARRMDCVREILTISVPGSLYINTLWVDTHLRGFGLADVLLDCAGALAEDMGLRALSLFAWHDNERARAFYARHGFRPIRTILSLGDDLRKLHPDGGHVYLLDSTALGVKGASS